MTARENETSEQQTNGEYNTFEKFVGSSSQKQVKEIIIDDKDRRAIDSAVTTVEDCMHDEILTAMDKVVISRVKMAVSSITGSSRHGPNSEFQNPDRQDNLGNTGNTPLVPTSSRLDLNTTQNRNDETRNEENSEDGNIPALRSNYDWKAYARQSISYVSICMYTGYKYE